MLGDAVPPALVPRNILGPRLDRFRALRHFYVDGAACGVSSVRRPTPLDSCEHTCDGELDGARILSTTAAQAMRTIVAQGRRIEVGMGWFRRGNVRSADLVEHLGGGAGLWNCRRVDPAAGVGSPAVVAWSRDGLIRWCDDGHHVAWMHCRRTRLAVG